MDPLSVTSSIIAIIQLSATLAQYCSQVHSATKEQQRVLVEARNLNKVFHELQSRIDVAEPDAPWTQAIQQLGAKGGPLDQLKSILELLTSKIIRPLGSSRLRSALKWPWTKEEVEQAISQAERLQDLIQFALTNDLSILTQAIHDDFSKWSSQHGGNLALLGQGIQQLHIRADEAEWNNIKQWLDIPDPSSNYNAALSRKHPGTGNWLLQDPQYQAWKSAKLSFMWLHGIPGCGKTFLSVTVLQNLLETTKGSIHLYPPHYVAYFYCDFNDSQKQSPSKLLRSLVYQLASAVPGYAVELQKVYESYQRGQSQPRDEIIHELFARYVSGMDQPLFLLIDALDECLERDSLLSCLQRVLDQRCPFLHLIITSRRERDIDEAIGSLTDFNIDIRSSVVDPDIRSYVKTQLATNSTLAKSRPMHTEIEKSLMERAKGMFRWVDCQLEILKKCLNANAVRKALLSLPRTLDETYERIFQDIEANGDLEQAIWILQWLCFTQYSRELSSIAELCVISNGENGGYDEGRRLFDSNDVMRICSSFVTLSQIYEIGYLETEMAAARVAPGGEYLDFWDTTHDEDRNQVRLAHYSVKEYLFSPRCSYHSHFVEQNAHLTIAEGCLHYVQHLCQLDSLTEDIVDRPPIARYAVDGWHRHLRLSQSTKASVAMRLASEIFSEDSTMLRSWLEIYDLVIPWNTLTHDMSSQHTIAEPLYYMAATGLYQLTQNELSRISRIHHSTALTTRYGTALHAASLQGHLDIVCLLLDHGFDINNSCGYYGTALQAASIYGNIDGVRLLLDRGANVNIAGGKYGTALQAAAATASSDSLLNSQDSILHILLRNHADVNIIGGDLGTALQAAALFGHISAARLLLDHGADVNIVAGKYGTALHTACLCGHIDLVKLLLEHKADVETIGGKHGTVLQAASLRGGAGVISLLLEHGANTNSISGGFGSALQAASVHGKIDTVRLLLDHNADINTVGGEFGTALQAASYHGYADIVQLFLDLKADVNVVCGRYGTALGAAIHNRSENTAQLLLQHGADEGLARQELEKALARLMP